ncbi:MAG: rhomboid family intramembrane serine protease [Paludibacteraceae bacterium]|nr:rhomboid family intramembrane serine protease [Paludibacteraceae bacterium]
MRLTTITKHLLLLNVLFWFADIVLRRYGIVLYELLGLHYLTAGNFHFFQPLTYMFMHANFTHLFCNMFAVLMFGPALEEQWGSKKFLLYYLVSGIGAAITQEAVWALQLQHVVSAFGENYAAALAPQMVTIGASGAVFGILLAFGWLFPDVRMFLLFLPIPIRARTFVILYAAIELFAGIASVSGDNVAHFAHLGGMIFGLILLLIWNRHDLHNPFRRHSDDSEDESNDRHWHYQPRV